MVLDYDDFTAEPRRTGGPFDAAACNFSILGDDLVPLLRGLRSVMRPGGRLVIQTVHPAATADEPYRDGWREERFDALTGDWAAMPWYFRTFGSWVDALREAGWTLTSCIEPVRPDTDRPASLILVGGPMVSAPRRSP